MRPPVPAHPDDDRLLELAYGEAPTAEARALRQHVDGCARCRQVLEGIAEVRSAFRSVPAEPAPERGLESLLAYGEQAAARARSRRGGLRILALLSAATAFAVVWLVLPSPRPQSDGVAKSAATQPTDALAQAELRVAPAQGDRARDELDDRVKDAKEKENERKMIAPLAKSEEPREETPAAERRAEAEAPKQKGLAKLDAPAGQPSRPPGRPSDLGGRAGAATDLSGALGNATASGGKVGGARGPAAGTGAEAFASGSLAMKKRSADGRADEGSAASPTAPASPPASVVAAPSPTENRALDARTQEAAKIAAAPVADALAGEDKEVRSAEVASGAPARSAAKPAPAMQSMRMGAGSPEKQARLGAIRKELETATGDRRKALLLEKCEIEASLTLGPDAVLTCSTVTREFPGTPEAKRASELARGFSVQPPPQQER